MTPSTVTSDSDWGQHRTAGGTCLAHRDGLGKLEHLLGHLVLILLARNDQDTLEGVHLLSESEEDDLGT